MRYFLMKSQTRSIKNCTEVKYLLEYLKVKEIQNGIKKMIQEF